VEEEPAVKIFTELTIPVACAVMMTLNGVDEVVPTGCELLKL